jgi:hypothetical protein
MNFHRKEGRKASADEDVRTTDGREAGATRSRDYLHSLL